MNTLTRDRAWYILNRYVKGESLIRHSITVEAVMRHFAGIFQDNPDNWGIIGLLHDIDFELYPAEHCARTRGILSAEGCPEFIIRAAESHGFSIVNNIEPVTNAEKVLYTIDELTGLIAATAIMRPSKSILDLEAGSVKKKWKSKGFAANVDRNIIADGAGRLGMDIDSVIDRTIEGMRTVAAEIGLAG